MEYLSLILENQGYVPVVAVAAVGLVLLSFFRFLRRALVILSTVVATPFYFFQNGSFTPHALGQFEITSEYELWLVVFALLAGLFLGYLMPVGLNGGNRLVPSSIAPFGVYLVIGAMGVFILNTLRVISISPVQEVCVLGFIAGVASGFCFYSFVRFLDAAIPLCGWSLVACLAVFSLYPRVSGSNQFPIDSESLKDFDIDDWLDTSMISDLDAYISHYIEEGDLADTFHATSENVAETRDRAMKLARSARSYYSDEG